MAKRKLTLKNDSVKLPHDTQVELAILLWDAQDAVAGLSDERKRYALAAVWRLADAIEITDEALRDGKKYRPKKSVYKMSDAERHQFFKSLDARLAGVKPPAKMKKDVEQMSHDEVQEYLTELMGQLRDRLDGRTPSTPQAPEPEPTAQTDVDESEFWLPTKRMEKALQRFDALADDDQVASLRGLWADGGVRP